MPHFFISSKNVNKNTVKITDEELLNHLVNALRINKGEKLLLFDENKIRYETVVISVSKKEVETKIEKKYPSKRFLKLDISLACSILKSDGFYELISGVTQLGISALYPLYTDNSVPSKSQIENKTKKWQKISDEAVKQCERADFMTVYPTLTIQNFDYSKFDKIIVFSELEQKNTLKQIIKNNVKKEDKILVIIGPEGGFSKNEFEFFEKEKFLSAKISNLILKAQTACIAGLSDIIFELSD